MARDWLYAFLTQKLADCARCMRVCASTQQRCCHQGSLQAACIGWLVAAAAQAGRNPSDSALAACIHALLQVTLAVKDAA
eukprot:363664-Chlamydomonas_euryale.AAC.8